LVSLLLLVEPESELARKRLGDAETVTTASIAHVETRAAVAAARRARRISGRARDRALQILHRRWSEFDVVEAHHDVIRAAGDLAETYALRAGDAIHLTSALVRADSAFATFDRELERAATAAGLEVLRA
jgi:predicted nucleic acid-binding protein